MGGFPSRVGLSETGTFVDSASDAHEHQANCICGTLAARLDDVGKKLEEIKNTQSKQKWSESKVRILTTVILL